MKPVHLNRPGSSLLLAILIVAITLATAATLATLIIQALARAGTSAQAAGLLYAAESGLERQLYLARKQKNVPIPSGTGPCDLPSWPGAALNCAWLSSAGLQIYLNNSPTYPPAPKRDQAVQVYVAVGGTGADLKTSCTDAVSNGIAAWVEITRLRVSIEWGEYFVLGDDAQSVYQQYFQCAGGSTYAITSLDSNNEYVVRVRALYDSTSRLQLITAIGGVPQDGLIRGTQTLKVTAKGGLAQQVVKAAFPAAPAALGFTDYVLFSECTIRKGGAAACP